MGLGERENELKNLTQLRTVLKSKSQIPFEFFFHCSSLIELKTIKTILVKQLKNESTLYKAAAFWTLVHSEN